MPMLLYNYIKSAWQDDNGRGYVWQPRGKPDLGLSRLMTNII